MLKEVAREIVSLPNIVCFPVRNFNFWKKQIYPKNFALYQDRMKRKEVVRFCLLDKDQEK